MTELAPKKISDSQITLSLMMGASDANTLGNVHGGVIMKLVDEAGALTAMRHAQAPVVTVAVDSLSFINPIHIGEVVSLHAELTYVGRTSMEVRVEVVAENPFSAERRVSNTAFLVYVALESGGVPTPVPPLEFETDEEKERAELARDRQAYRKQQRAAEMQRRNQ